MLIILESVCNDKFQFKRYNKQLLKFSTLVLHDFRYLIELILLDLLFDKTVNQPSYTTNDTTDWLQNKQLNTINCKSLLNYKMPNHTTKCIEIWNLIFNYKIIYLFLKINFNLQWINLWSWWSCRWDIRARLSVPPDLSPTELRSVTGLVGCCCSVSNRFHLTRRTSIFHTDGTVTEQSRRLDCGHSSVNLQKMQTNIKIIPWRHIRHRSKT